MKKKYFDELLKAGVLTQEEYNDVFTKMRLSEDGTLFGVVPQTNYIIKYKLEGDMLNGDLRDFVKRHIVPPYEFVNVEPFSKYGILYTGIGDRWDWFTKGNISQRGYAVGYRPIEEATEEELWKMIAMASRFWEVSYRRWYYEEQERNRNKGDKNANPKNNSNSNQD